MTAVQRIPSFPQGFRVFAGYKRAGLDDPSFLSNLGEVFMPATPLVMRDLGLAAYMPAVLPVVDGVEGVPDEVAVIAYASLERFQYAHDVSTIGRLYGFSHYGVFDLTASAAQNPVALGTPMTGPVGAFWCDGGAFDWQSDGDVFVWAGTGSDPGFSQQLQSALEALVPRFSSLGILEILAEVGPTWAAAWALLDGFGAHDVSAELDAAFAPATPVLGATASRLVWLDDPPPVPAARGTAWSYVFVRDERNFLA